MKQPSFFYRIPTRWQRVLWHVAFWFLYFLYGNVLTFFDHRVDPVAVLKRTVLTYGLVIALFYINAHVLLDRYLTTKRYGKLIIGTILLLGGYVLCRQFIFWRVLPAIGVPFTSLFGASNFFVETFWIYVNFTLFSYGYWYVLQSLRLAKERTKILQQKLVIEQQHSQAVMAYLKSQISPHFLYNTLNFLYAEAMDTSPRLARSVMVLSEMMRYSLSHPEHEAPVTLSQEVEHLNNYLYLQKQRFEDGLHIDMEVKGEEWFDQLKFLPLVLMSLIENAFKYGDLTSAEHPLIIRIHADANSFYFYTSNRKKDVEQLEPSTRVGLTNTRRRLYLTYAHNQTFTVTDATDEFSAEIRVQFDAVPAYESLSL
ncbi:sensor histidine kinase [Spirosoma validum]|uniref:Histidine kinase n=1 Tax=Spirosoma validum TaxID=2771355 RepID=A0A927B1X4_9BACT|nr:sensor histidine kinase [Spirosoma validum]MBD2754071.1 histidine kinase [Spirosoma validum]